MEPVPFEILRALADQGRYAVVIPLIDEILQREDATLAAVRLMATCLRGSGRRQEAIEAYQLAILIDPEPYELLVNLADLLRDEDRLDDALAAADSAILLEPDRVEAIASSAITLTSLERFSEAFERANAALKADPTYGQAWYVRALSSMYLEKFDESYSAYTEVLRLCPCWALPRLERGMLGFICGHFGPAADDYEARWLVDEAPPKRFTGIEAWDGSPFDGVLLIWGEQGLGDEIFFLGMLPLVLQRHCRVVVEVDPRLVHLVSRSFPEVLVVARAESEMTSPVISRAIPMGSLLRLLIHWEIDLPHSIGGYLTIPPALLWKPTSIDRVRIGLFWRSDRVRLGGSKSIDIKLLAPLALIPGVELVSLQYGNTDSERSMYLENSQICIQEPDFDLHDDIDRLAGVIASCDLVVTIPGVPAHLANALGVPAYVLSRSGRGRLWYWWRSRGGQAWFQTAKAYWDRVEDGVQAIVNAGFLLSKKKRAVGPS